MSKGSRRRPVQAADWRARWDRTFEKLESCWVPCDMCGDYWCVKHEKHAWECECPEVEVFFEQGVDPYLEMGE